MKALICLFLFLGCFATLKLFCTHDNPKETPFVDSLFVQKVDLSEAFLDHIYALESQAGYQWNEATYYRETIDFGKVFPSIEEGYLVEKPIPSFIIEIRNQLFDKFRNQLGENECAEEYDNIIVTFYEAGDGIAPHVDRNIDWASLARDRNYYFGDSVIGLIVKPDILQSLFFENPLLGEGSRFYLNEEAGTAFLFQGELRHHWKHGLLPVKDTRISITFRKVKMREPAFFDMAQMDYMGENGQNLKLSETINNVIDVSIRPYCPYV